ncbi:MAG: AzlC family ABC transporter permease [Candidatus Promineifilaceae bacterium]
MPPSLRSELFAGIQAELPIALGVIPFGMIYGVLAIAAGLPPLLAQAMSAVVFAGSAQFIGVQLFAAATPAGIIWLTTFIVNLRHLLYSASVAPYLQPLSPRWKWLLAYLLTDEAYVTAILHYDNPQASSPFKHWFFLGAGVTLWGFWQASTAVGIFLGAQVPSSWALDFTLALTFIGLVVPALTSWPPIAAAVTAGVVALLTPDLPYKSGLMLAAIAGITAGLLTERHS